MIVHDLSPDAVRQMVPIVWVAEHSIRGDR